jgi:hypothetical protein
MSRAQSPHRERTWFFQTENFAVIIEDGPVIAEAELLALRLKPVDHTREGMTCILLRRTEHVEPKHLEAERPEAGEIMEIEPLHVRRLGITRAPRAGDDDLIHGSPSS